MKEPIEDAIGVIMVGAVAFLANRYGGLPYGLILLIPILFILFQLDRIRKKSLK